MNLSGKTVSGIVNYYDDLDLDHLLIVCDDFHLPLGRLRFRRNGSHGGQNGLRDIIAQLGTSDFARLRIGIGAPGGEAIGHVLGTFAPDEVDAVNSAIGAAADGLETWAREGIEAAMNTFNAGGQESAPP
jgi:PTH1 family peptidyl-tRNA hydrolase